MKKIEGNEKQVCTELYKRIYTVLSDKMPDVLIDRCISFEWCKSGKYTGQCILRLNFPVAIVRISSMFDFDRNTIAHEILHALLPFNTKHGPLFKKALVNIAAAEHSGSHASVLWFEAIGLTLFAIVYFICYSLVGADEGFFIATPISQGLALWVYHKITTVFKRYEGGAAV